MGAKSRCIGHFFPNRHTGWAPGAPPPPDLLPGSYPGPSVPLHLRRRFCRVARLLLWLPWWLHLSVNPAVFPVPRGLISALVRPATRCPACLHCCFLSPKIV